MREHRPLGRGALVIGGDAALRRLDGDDTVAVRRPAQRTADVVAVRDRADAGRHRAAGAARRAAAGDIGIPRVQRQPVQRVVRKAAERELGRIGQAEHDGAGLLEIAHDRRIGGGDDVHLRGHPVGVGPPLIVDVFLDRDRYAVQRAELGLSCPGFVRGFGRLQRFLRQIDDDRVELWIDVAHARDVRFDNLDRGNRTGADGGCRLQRRPLPNRPLGRARFCGFS